jgi:hypothetical protein
VATAGFALLSTGSGYAIALPSYLLLGLGYGLAVPATSALAMGALAVGRSGLASGVLNTSRQVGAAIGLAAFGSIGATIARGDWAGHVRALAPTVRERATELSPIVAGGQGATVASRLGAAQGHAADAAFVSGLRGAMLVAGGLILLVAALAVVLRPRARADGRTQPDPAPAAHAQAV